MATMETMETPRRERERGKSICKSTKTSVHVPITGSCCTTGDNEIVPITKAVDSVEADLSEDEAEDIEKVHQD